LPLFGKILRVLAEVQGVGVLRLRRAIRFADDVAPLSMTGNYEDWAQHDKKIKMTRNQEEREETG
jgi:hypothetical protein